MKSGVMKSGARTGSRMRAVRIVLAAAGVVLIAVGAVVMQQTVAPNRIVGVALWFALAIVVHDAIIAPLVFVVGTLMRRAGRRIPPAVLAIIQGGIVVASIFTIIVVPEIVAKSLGARNATVLPFDYGLRLAIMWGVVAVLTALAVGVYAFLASRQNQRSRKAQG